MMIWIIDKLGESANVLAHSTEGNPVNSTLVVMLFWLMFCVFEAGLERLIFGERFEHWLDPLFALAFMGYAAYSVWFCALYNARKST
jgi:hypothetical protein